MRWHFCQEPSRKPFNSVDNQRAATPNKRHSYKNLHIRHVKFFLEVGGTLQFLRQYCHRPIRAAPLARLMAQAQWR
jgi:hypothetical protein